MKHLRRNALPGDETEYHEHVKVSFPTMHNL